jgi:hypothetical protein
MGSWWCEPMHGAFLAHAASALRKACSDVDASC